MLGKGPRNQRGDVKKIEKMKEKKNVMVVLTGMVAEVLGRHSIPDESTDCSENKTLDDRNGMTMGGTAAAENGMTMGGTAVAEE